MSNNIITREQACLILALSLTACTTSSVAPVTSRDIEVQSTKKQITRETTSEKRSESVKPAVHVVKKGDTLYSIAWNYGYDYRELALWNAINPPYVIYPGQSLRLQAPTPPPDIKTKPLQPGPIVRKSTTEKQAVKPAVEPGPKTRNTIPKTKIPDNSQKKVALPGGNISWDWPVKGKLVKLNTPKAEKGIDIEGKLGQRINAAAIGDVVYSGSGLLGYGKLIIIKHDDTFLSAYAHNSELMVKEGDRVNQGQQIAQMGQTTDGRTLLHFEIRKNGKPIDPLKHLPAN